MNQMNSVLIAAMLLIGILVANEAGYRFGRWWRARADQGIRAQTNAIQAAMLGLLALLLGFTFTMALQRFDARSAAVLNEANAIGTAMLRAELLPEEHRDPARRLLAEYVESRIAAGRIGLDQTESWQQAQREAQTVQERLWAVGIAATAVDPRPVTTGLFIQSLNDMIDAQGERAAALRKHVPEVVFYLLFAVFVIAGAVLGYAGGLEGGRPLLATVAMSLLIVLVIFIIIDLDRPRRGLIEVSQQSLIELREAAAFAPPPGAGG